MTFEEEAPVEKVFAAGPLQEVAGKTVEVKPATPKGSGPQVGFGERLGRLGRLGRMGR